MPLESQLTRISSLVQHQHGGRFHLECDAREGWCLHATTNSFSIGAGQQIRRRQDVETWNSVSIFSTQEVDGSLSLRIIIFHPDWEEPLQIAHLRSRPQSASSEASGLECDLGHKHL